jgi:hypothetical protein
MNFSEITHQRFYQQGLTTPRHATPAEVVAWNGAVQAQDYAGAKWAVAQRVQSFTNDVAMDAACDAGEILRTHVMRPTWHFVAPADIRWLLKLTAPRVHATSAHYYRSLGLDVPLLHQCADVIAKALEGNNHLTRPELGTVMRQAGIEATDQRLGYIVMYAELEGVICNGARRGKQFTYALLDERVPFAPLLEHDAACAELAKRYFVSHGPALIKDFVWWSGLTVADAKLGIELAGRALHHEVINGQSYWSAPTPKLPKSNQLQGYLLPNYDEALASFKDYSASVAPQDLHAWSVEGGIFAHYLAIDGWVAGTWRRTLRTHDVVIESKPFRSLDDSGRAALAQAADSYGQFLSRSVILNESLMPHVG